MAGNEAEVVGDVIYELEPNGEVLNSISLFDLFDPSLGSGSFDLHTWDVLFPDAPTGTNDWTHSNSIALDKAGENYIASSAGLNQVFSVDRQDGSLNWTFGEGGDFTLLNGRWFGLQDSPTFGDDGRLMLYDLAPNGPPVNGRIVEYVLDMPGDDPDSWTATQTWEYWAEPPVVSMFYGDVQQLPGGNVLFADGAFVGDGSAFRAPSPANPFSARFIEVTRDEPPVEVLRVNLRGPDGSIGVVISEILRIPSLY